MEETLEKEDTKVQEENATTLEQVIKQNKPNLLGKGMLQLYLICFSVYFCSTMNGFDGSLMSSINALPAYLDYYDQDAASAGTGLVFSIFNIGQITGALVSSIIADYFGRRWGMLIGCVGVIVGTCVTATAPTISVFIGGRFLLSFFAVISLVSMPMYCVEIAPPHIRAAVSGIANCLYYLGSIIAAFTIYGCLTSYPDSTKAFKIPLWLQCICPAIVTVACFFIPESPRYLVGSGKEEKAREVITKYHCNGDSTHPLVDLEISEMIVSLHQVEFADPKTFLDVRELFTTHGQRYRTLLIITFAWFSQFSGNNIISYYFPTLLGQIGVEDPKDQILQNGYYAIEGLVFAVLGAFCHDIIGRRKMFLFSTLGMSICLAIVSASVARYQQTQTKSWANTCIAFIYIFGAIFAVAFTSMQAVYPGEVASNRLRAKAMLLTQVTAGAASFVNQFAAPVAMANIKYWFYVFFTLWDLFEFVVIYFFFVETRGRTLEELEEIFMHKNPKKESLKKVSEQLQENNKLEV